MTPETYLFWRVGRIGGLFYAAHSTRTRGVPVPAPLPDLSSLALPDQPVRTLAVAFTCRGHASRYLFATHRDARRFMAAIARMGGTCELIT